MYQSLDKLSPDLARQVRLAPLPPQVVAMFAHVPRRLTLDAEVPIEGGKLQLGARQLLKLALLSPGMTLGRVRHGSLDQARLAVHLTGRSCCLEGPELSWEIRRLARHLLESLLDPGDLSRALADFALRSSNLAMLQTVMRHMLSATSEDQALHAMLSGITSGHGFAFNRAAFFRYDAEHRLFVGSKAIGPADDTEAHRIWEEIEYEDKSMDRLIQEQPGIDRTLPFERFVQQLTIVLEPTADGIGALATDEVTRALAAGSPIRLAGAPVHPDLAPLGCSHEYLLAPVRAHGRDLGLVFADNLYNRAPVPEEHLDALGFFIDQTAVVWQNLSLLKRVERLARYDSLTGVLNRREFENRLADEGSRSLRTGGAWSLLILDVDHFKQINDSRGHPAGDAVLRRLGELLTQTLRGHDLVARFGGDEFVVLLPATGRADLATTARRLGQATAAAGISVSIGAATWPDDATDPTALLSVADASLYRAKEAGRSRACLGHDEPSTFDEP